MEVVYTDQNTNVSNTYYFWDIMLNNWTPFWKYEYLYTISSDTTLVEIDRTTWNADTEAWIVTDGLKIYTIQVGDMRETIQYEQDMTTGVWTPDIRRIYLLDTDNRLTQSTTYDWQGEWDAIYRQLYYWSQHDISSTHESGQSDLFIFPNPVRDVLHVRGLQKATDARIFSIQGILVKNVLVDDASISVQDLPSGSYFLQFTGTDGRAQVQRFIKQF